MKKFLKIGICIICAVLLLLLVIMIAKVGGAEIADGIYRVADCEAYPDAYIEVKGNTLQFYNIDLNEIYQEAQMVTYEKMKESGVEFNMTEEQLIQISDLNLLLVSNAYEIDYDSLEEDNKTGTFQYVYFCYGEGNLFGLVLEYDSLHKTIQINSSVLQLEFERE